MVCVRHSTNDLIQRFLFLVMSEARKELLGDLLKATSRSFYLIPHCGTPLPAAVRPQIGPAYRLAPHFHRPFRTNQFPCCHQGHRPRLISTVAPRPNIVPEAQPDISQTQGGWYRGDKFHPSRRDGGNIRASFQSGNLHRPFRTNKFPCCHQGRRPWLISGVAPRPNIVPKAQLEISQTRSVWLWWKRKFVLKGRWKFPNRVAARMLPSSRWDGFNCVERYQTLRVWLISGVAPRPNFTK